VYGPAHKEKTPSLSIREGKDGKPLVHCFGGCPQDYVIDALRKRGAWHDGPTAVTSQVLRNLAQKAKLMTAELTDDEKESRAACQRVWDAGVPAENTSAQLYLQYRGIVSTETPLPLSLRYLEAKNALVAAVTRPDSEEFVGLHVIFLEETKTGVSKKTKLSYGPVRLGHVKLSAPDTKIQVAESVEDGLALMQMNGRATLAVPGTSFLGGHVVPPKTCKTIILAPDNDTAGRSAIEKATPRLAALGLTVRVLLPPPACDWCDVLPEFEERRAIVEEEYIG
jgi:DNA primase